MFEKFSFRYFQKSTVDYYTEEVDFDNLDGMKCVSVSDISSLTYDISTSTNPYIDGEQVENRRANGRELTVRFEYDFTITPEEADKALFSAIPRALSMRKDGSLYLYKEKNGETKKIKCQIKSIEHNVFDENPALEIVLQAGSYWQGEEERIELVPRPTVLFGTYVYDVGKLKGDVAADFYISCKATPIQETFPITDNFELDAKFRYDDNELEKIQTGIINFQISTSEDYVELYYSTKPTLMLYQIENGVRNDFDMISKLKSPLFSIYPNKELELRVNWKTFSPGTPVVHYTAELVYTPLYIR